MFQSQRALTLAPFLIAALLVAPSCGNDAPGEHRPGQTDFSSLEPGSGQRGAPSGPAGAPAPNAGAGAGGASGTATGDSRASTPAPGGRTDEVKEADIYKLDGTRLYYLNTYRGFIVYDVANPKQPQKVARLPVYGYPVEMFVEGNRVYALLRDALYLTQKSGRLEFERHNVSQLVTIDVSDAGNPRILQTMDIVGQLREGVSRKVGNTIYVVSEMFGGYYWGWRQPGQTQPKEQAWVYSFDVSNPAAPRKAGELQIFEGGNENRSDPKSGTYYNRRFAGVSISATSNALMVAENWETYSSSNTCGNSEQQAVISLIDISDATGVIRRHTRFETTGHLDDQFKMTYVVDDATRRGTFFGIFARWAWRGCGGREIRNTLESWDVSNGARPARLAALDFGKPEETVRASAFDVKRNVVYAITARQIDPLYAIDISNPAAPRVLSQIDGLSGSVSVFRTVAGGQFLLGVGQDQSASCAGPMDTMEIQRTRMALSIVDVRDLARIRLVQRSCVTIAGAEWIWSQVNNNQDQAHKMLGMFADGDLNVITVPVSYSKRTDLQDGWWYRWETAVGLMTWDLTRYDDTKPPTSQTVIQNFGSFIHPEGEVNRSILFRHPASGERVMINLSDTHLSVANIQDLMRPRLESIVEVAPRVDEIYRFGDHIVERVQIGSSGRGPTGDVSEFRVKRAGGPIDDAAPVASFRVGQVAAVHRYKEALVLHRYSLADAMTGRYTTDAVVYDLANPVQPRRVSRIAIPVQTFHYWGFYCGVGMWGGYWFGDMGARTVATDAGLVHLETDYSNPTQNTFQIRHKMVFLNLKNLAAPTVKETVLRTYSGNDAEPWAMSGLVSDPAAPQGFYLAYRESQGRVTMDDGQVFTRWKHYAQRWETGAGELAAGATVNVPGPLARTWVDAGGTRLFLTHDQVYRSFNRPNGGWEWHGDTRLNLLRAGRGFAELLDARVFLDLSLSSMIVDGNKLLVSAQRAFWGWSVPDVASSDGSGTTPARPWEETSDRLMIFDLSRHSLATAYDRPMKTYNVQLMGTDKGRLFVNLPGDGVLVVDVSNATSPLGTNFLRTLGWATHVEFAGDDIYVASGNFGVFNLKLGGTPEIPLD
jgi:hypothetical protein